MERIRKLAGGALAAALAVACHDGHSRSPQEVSRAARAEGQEYRLRLASLQERLSRTLVAPRCPAKNGETRCGLLVDDEAFVASVFEAAGAPCANSGSEVSDECSRLAFAVVDARFAERYPQADHARVRALCEEEGCRSPVTEELTWMKLHNDLVFEGARVELARIRAEHREAQARFAAEGAEVVALENAAEEGPGFFQVLGNALQAYGASVSGSSQQSSPPPRAGSGEAEAQPPSAVQSDECRSDYQCGHGRHCSKAPGQFSGRCATTVNEYGTRTYTPPRSGSHGPGGPADCRFATDCGVGFRCERGRCVR